MLLANFKRTEKNQNLPSVNPKQDLITGAPLSISCTLRCKYPERMSIPSKRNIYNGCILYSWDEVLDISLVRSYENTVQRMPTPIRDGFIR